MMLPEPDYLIEELWEIWESKETQEKLDDIISLVESKDIVTTLSEEYEEEISCWLIQKEEEQKNES